MSDVPSVLFDTNDNLARLTLSNPARRNAMSYGMWSAIPELIKRCEADADIRAIVLTGSGEHFCAGADISEFGDKRSDEAGARAYESAVKAANAALLNASKPTIALIRGTCYGGGVGLALACDIRLAREDARFRVPAARLGLGYAFDNLQLVVARIGFAAAADLLFSARVFEAAQAERDGLVRKVFATSDFEQQSVEYLNQIAHNAPLTLVAAKLALVELMKGESSCDPKSVAQAVAACFASQDYAEGRTAFAERREPVFRGR